MLYQPLEDDCRTVAEITAGYAAVKQRLRRPPVKKVEPPQVIESAIIIAPPERSRSHFDCVHTVAWRQSWKPAFKPTPEGLAEALAAPEKPTSISIVGLNFTRKIMDACAYEFGVSVQDLTGHSRRKKMADARQCAMWLMKTVAGRSFAQIGRAMNRDHSTAVHAAQKVDAAIKSQSVQGVRALRLLDDLSKLQAAIVADARILSSFISFVEDPSALCINARFSFPGADEDHRNGKADRCSKHRPAQSD